MRHAVLAEFPGGERGALVARAGLVDPDMERDTGVVRGVDRRQRGADVHGRKPAGIAMGQHIDAFAVLFPGGNGLDQLAAVAADRLVDHDVPVANFSGTPIGHGDALLTRTVAHHRHHLVERPLQVDRGMGRVASSAA